MTRGGCCGRRVDPNTLILPKVVRYVVLEECSEVFPAMCTSLPLLASDRRESGRDMLGRENALDLRGIRVVDLTRFRGCMLYPWLLFGAPSVMS